MKERSRWFGWHLSITHPLIPLISLMTLPSHYSRHDAEGLGRERDGRGFGACSPEESYGDGSREESNRGSGGAHPNVASGSTCCSAAAAATTATTTSGTRRAGGGATNSAGYSLDIGNAEEEESETGGTRISARARTSTRISTRTDTLSIIGRAGSNVGPSTSKTCRTT